MRPCAASYFLFCDASNANALLSSSYNWRTDAPNQLRSPTWVINFQKGNSFELATCLTNLLLGRGYNAFVVSGYASGEQTLCDTAMTPCPYLPVLEEILRKVDTVDMSKYRLKIPQDFHSKFLLQMEIIQTEKSEEKERETEEQRRLFTLELERPPPDEYRGHRIHAWVVLLPECKGPREQEILKPTFIEPSTGVSYDPSDPVTSQLYLGVESIWNDLNYWVNVQDTLEGCAKINWDLSKIHFWEHLLLGEPWAMRDNSDQIDEEISTEQEKHLDMPNTYVTPISICPTDFTNRYPSGRKTMFYKKTKVELFAPYRRTDGLVQKLTLYDDYTYTVQMKTYENYLNRADNLIESRINWVTNIRTEFYKRGRADRCKEHLHPISGGDTIASKRVLKFYDDARRDGLLQVEMDSLYFAQYFKNREDFLCYRHVQYCTEGSSQLQDGVQGRSIWKIAEKYDRDKKILPHKDIGIREFAIGENEIRLWYHYDEGQYSRATCTFVKPPLADRGDRLVFDPTMMQRYNPDPISYPEKSLDLFFELDRHLIMEDQCISHIRDVEQEISNFLRLRNVEYSSPKLVHSLFEIAKDIESETVVGVKKETVHPSIHGQITKDIDWLRPYLARIGNVSDVTKTEALVIREDCLADFKQTQVKRANHILGNLKECTHELEKMQTLLTQNEDLTREEEEKLFARTNELNFQLHVLEVRLNRQKDLASERYKILVDALRQYPCLSKP